MHHAVGVCRPRGSASPPGRRFGEENVRAGPSQPLLLGHEGGHSGCTQPCKAPAGTWGLILAAFVLAGKEEISCRNGPGW